MSDYLKYRLGLKQGKILKEDKKKEPVPLKRSKPLEKKTPLKKGGRSDKLRGIMAALGPLYEDFIEKKPMCEIQSPECTQAAETIHHTAGRGVKTIMNIKTWISSCSNCNLYVEKHDAWAREKGFKVSRHSK